MSGNCFSNTKFIKHTNLFSDSNDVVECLEDIICIAFTVVVAQHHWDSYSDADSEPEYHCVGDAYIVEQSDAGGNFVADNECKYHTQPHSHVITDSIILWESNLNADDIVVSNWIENAERKSDSYCIIVANAICKCNGNGVCQCDSQ